MSRFCRHNRLTAECPICSKDTAARAGPGQPAPRAAPAGARERTPRRRTAARVSRGPFVSAGPYEDGQEVRLERVPGGLRLADWQRGSDRRAVRRCSRSGTSAPLLDDAAHKELLEPPSTLESAAAGGRGEHGASPGRAGELRDELRVERLDGARVRIARWIMRPNAGWELQEAPVMLPPARFVEALASAARKGVLVSEPEP